MIDAFFDTDLLIRYITGDDPAKRASVRALLRQAAQGAIRLRPDTVIADAVYVLASPKLYHIPRDKIRNWLSVLIRWPGLEVNNRLTVLKALALHANSNLDLAT
jgi:predicted nucleic acid-binding protein